MNILQKSKPVLSFQRMGRVFNSAHHEYSPKIKTSSQFSEDGEGGGTVVGPPPPGIWGRGGGGRRGEERLEHLESNLKI